MNGGLISDGKTLALQFHDNFVVVEKFFIRDLAVTHNWDGVTTLDFTILTTSIETTNDTAKIRDIFQNAANLSVDELLKLAYRRMSERPS